MCFFRDLRSRSGTVLSVLGCCLVLLQGKAYGQDFSLCSVVDAKNRTMVLAWSKPEVDVAGYSFFYNGHEVTPYQPTIDDAERLSYREQVRFGKHTFQLRGYASPLESNHVEIDVRNPHYYTILIPGLYQSLYRKRYASSCQPNTGGARNIAGVLKPVLLYSAAAFSGAQWVRFFNRKNAALNARDTYLNTLEIEELERWQVQRDEAKDIFKVALWSSVATLTANAVSALFMSPRGRVRVKGGFDLDCRSHPEHVNLCFNL